MEYRFLGRTGLKVSELTLGAMTFGGSGSAFFEGVGGVGLDDARRMVDMAIDRGVNMIDTADVYSRGVSEEMVGDCLIGKRGRVLVSTKCHGRMSNEVNDLGQSRHHIIASCEASLRRLKTDYIDVFHIHGYDAYVAWEESLGALTDLVRQGKVRYIACSNLSGWQLMKALSVSDARGYSRFAALQAYYSLVARDLEDELLPLCTEEQLGVLIWSPLAGGYLSGKYLSDNPRGRRAAVGDPGTIDEVLGKRALDALQVTSRTHNASLAQAALNYLRAKPGITSLIIGARTAAQLAENLACLDWSMTADEVAGLDRASERALAYPYWHQQRHNASRYRRAV